MRICLILFVPFLLFACGNKKSAPPSQEKDTVKVEQKTADKSYLKKRPEEFPDFFKLTSLQPFSGRVAKQKDMEEGKAVFVMNVKDPSHQPCNIGLPFFAFRTQDEKPVFVMILQAEVLKGDTLLGYRQGNGQFGMCHPAELEYFEGEKSAIFKTSGSTVQ